ncbi:hypothetical protein ADUPG1_007361, partial [Aduncisulcus paluster]
MCIDDEEIRKLIKDAQEEAPPDPSTHEREGDLWTSISTGNIYIPEDKSLHLALIRHFHSATTGHHGIRATIDKLKDYGLTWTTMYIDVRKTIKGCLTCQKIAEQKKTTQAPTFSIAHEVTGHTWFIDSLGPLPKTADGYEYIMAATDAFSRYTELFPLTSLTAKEAMFHILSLIGRHGMPNTIHTDQGPQFANYLADHVYDTLGIRHHRVTPHHPTGNGMVERMNREIKRHLRAQMLELSEMSDWP